MIVINNKSLIALYYKSVVSRVNIGAATVYQAVRSCFGSGRWRSNKMWIGKDKWKNS